MIDFLMPEMPCNPSLLSIFSVNAGTDTVIASQETVIASALCEAISRALSLRGNLVPKKEGSA